MKAWEAQQIIDSLDPQTEVTLTIGRKQATSPGSLPKWAQMPNSYANPQWVIDKDQWPSKSEITCKTVH